MAVGGDWGEGGDAAFCHGGDAVGWHPFVLKQVGDVIGTSLGQGEIASGGACCGIRCADDSDVQVPLFGERYDGIEVKHLQWVGERRLGKSEDEIHRRTDAGLFLECAYLT